ncbi:hypothetical protein [Halomontanus rarus]|uniref:hypothetical protein n=1 Tax=Halomontanus rarus TaxID=3034020 RepID=UPI001A98293A|nr:hypothetical protein [Halovivax sp. TS33]
MGDRERTRFDRAFGDHLLLRDIVYIVWSYVVWVLTQLLFGMPLEQALTNGVVFVVVFLALMEGLARFRGSSSFRSVGEDPFG